MEVKRLMGRMTAIALGETGLSLIKQLEYHLVGNFYPPHTKDFAPICAKAIEVYINDIFEIEEMGDYDSLQEKVTIPDVVKYKGRNWMTLQEVLESFRLDPWLIVMQEQE